MLGDKTEPGLGECPLSRPRLGSLYSGDLRPAGDRGRGVVRGALCEEAPPRGLRQRRELEGLRVGPAPGSGRRPGRARGAREVSAQGVGRPVRARARGTGVGSGPEPRRRGSRAWCGGRERPFSKEGVHNQLNRVVVVIVLSLAAIRSVIS